MGNESSSPSNKQDKEFIDKLQRQILQNQVQIQNIQLNSLQNAGRTGQNGQNGQIQNPQNIINAPQSVQNQFLSQLLDKENNNLTLQQKNKINDILARNNGQQSRGMITNYGTRSYDPNTRQLQRQRQNNTMQQINTNLANDDEKIQREYEIEQQRLKEKYAEIQRQKRLEYEKKIHQIETQNVDALKLFQIRKDYNLAELKTAYKRLATKTHPDKPGGSNDKFQIVTKCYFLLLEKLKNSETDKGYDKLKAESGQYRKNQASNNPYPSNIKTAKEKFDLRMFNKIFEENKIYDVNSEGYEDWLKNKDDASSNLKQPELFSQKFNIDVFNNTFSQHKEQNPYGQIVEYKDPEALVSCNKLDHASIDNTRSGDFTRCVEKNEELGYSDLRSAYTNGNLINPNNVKYKTYKNVDDLERDRGNVSYQMSEEDLAKQTMLERLEAQKEEERIRRIQQRDNIITDNYSNVHKRMLGFSGGADMSR